MNYRIYKIFLILFFVFNLIDAFVTFYFVTEKSVQELNPLMDWLIKINPWLFIFVKMVIGTVGVSLLWNHVREKWTRISIATIFGVYSTLMLYDVIGITILVMNNVL